MVGDIVGLGLGPCIVPPNALLKAAAQQLTVSGHTAAAVVDETSTVLGLVTENDVMRAYFEGVTQDITIRDWLHTGKARVPSHVVESLTVRPDQTLAEVAELMVESVAAGDRACHHVLVRDEAGALRGILSSLELAQALSCPDSSGVGIAGSLAGRTAEDAMKTRDRVFTCPLKYSMRQALKVMFVTRQNSVLVAGNDGIRGIVTPRDALRAFDEGFPIEGTISDWLKKAAIHFSEGRLVSSDARLADAAATMTSRRLHHLVVMKPQNSDAVGILSALDIVLNSRPRKAKIEVPPARRTLHSPVSDFVRKEDTPGCSSSSSLGDIAALLVGCSCTAVAVMDGDGTLKGVVTENDLMEAYVDGWTCGDSVSKWFLSDESKLPRHMMVCPVVPLTEVATMMLMAHAHVGSCHHLVVSGEGGQFFGVLSSLDIVRTLVELRDEIEDLEDGMQATTVAMVAKLNLSKPRLGVPTCRPNETIQRVLGALVDSQHNGVLVLDSGTVRGIITPRCAVQAFSASMPTTCEIGSLLELDEEHTSISLREVQPDVRLLEAAATMASKSLHHLVVVTSHKAEPIGLLSSLDVVRGVASITCHCRFVSLRWLRSCHWSASGAAAVAA